MQGATSESPILAVDLGGTKIATALVSTGGQILEQLLTPTLADEGPEAAVGRMIAAIKTTLSESQVSSPAFSTIALASAGIIDVPKGIVTASPSFPGWCDVPIREIVERETGLACFLINDATAAVAAEHRLGAGKGLKNLLYVTVSTGIGGGIIVDGQIYSGSLGCAGEIGHMTIDPDGPPCNCGSFGCLETLASGRAVAREAQKRIARGAKSSILELVEGEPHNITAKAVAEAAKAGDALALEIISQAATYLGIGMANLVNIFNPEMIVIGGGLSKMGDMLFNPVRRTVADRAFRLPAQSVRIVPSQLGDEVGLLGAAVSLMMSKGL
jgi:glucokinase